MDARHQAQPLTTGITRSTCAYCGVGCGVDIQHSQGQAQQLNGSPDHPANQGRLCIKGSKLLDTSGEEGRLLSPRIQGQSVSWSQASQAVADGFQRIIDQHGPESVAFYVSGQLLTEDYYVANKLMKGYIGSANIDTNSRLCMSSAVAAYKRAFGEDVVPCDYRDLEQTELLVLIGSNAAWTHPVLFQRMERAKQMNPNMQVVVIDPRRTATTALADHFLNLRPGTDGALFNGLLRYMEAEGAIDESFVSRHTQGLDEALAESRQWDLQRVAEFCQLSVAEIEHFYRQFCQSASAVSFYSMGINQSSSGVDKCNAIINCHLASGKLLKPGCGPFSITGQPNAMGGREVGGLANQLAAHMDIHNPQHRQRVQKFWQSPRMADKPGYAAVDLFEAMAEGKVKAVWIMATNPVVSLPDNARVRQALENCELVVVSDCVSRNDTLDYAHVALPAATWLEKDGTVTNSERRISRQRGVQRPVGESRPDWQIICDVAKRMGFDGFDYDSSAAVFREWAALTGCEASERQLNLTALSTLSEADYNAMAPTQWPLDAQGQSQRPFADGRFSTPSGKAQFVAIRPRLPQQQTSERYPYVLNSGRLRDQWHTMTRTGKADALSGHTPRPQVSVHPFDAKQLGLEEGAIARLSAATGQMHCFVTVTDRVRKGECFVPIHWNGQFASNATATALYQSVVDPISGQPESKQGAVAIETCHFAQQVQLVSRYDFRPQADFWVKRKIKGGFSYELAFIDALADPLGWCQQTTELAGEWLQYQDPERQRHHIQCLKDGQAECILYLGPEAPEVDTNWLAECLGQPLSYSQLQAVLRGKPDEQALQGRQICSCYQVGEKAINDAIAKGDDSVEKLGQRLKCGTNCGSCRSELAQLIEVHPATTKEAV